MEYKFLENRHVYVKPIYRKSWLSQIHEKHDSIFMNSGARMHICVPINNKTGNLVDPIDIYLLDKHPDYAEEKMLKLVVSVKKEIADFLSIPVEELNVRNEKCYWKKRRDVALSREGTIYDMSKPSDFLDFLLLYCNKDLIAKSWAARFSKGSYKFALHDKGAVEAEQSAKVDLRQKAWLKAVDILNSQEKSYDFLAMYYMLKRGVDKPPKNAAIEVYKNMIANIIDNETDSFWEIINDPDYEVKILIHKSMLNGELEIVDKFKYRFKGADKAIGGLKDMVEYLKDDLHNEDLLILKQKALK